MRTVRSLLITVCGLISLALPTTASAADQLFWSDYSANAVGHVDLAGGSAATFGGVTGPYGTAIDAASGRLIVGEYNAKRISSMNFDGTGITEVLNNVDLFSSNYGLSLDPIAGRLYWASDSGLANNTIGTARTSGADARTFLGGIPQLADPVSPVVDPARNKVYWVNYGTKTIGYADLDTGGNAGTITLTGPCTATPFTSAYAVAVDPVGGRLVLGGYAAGTPTPAHAMAAVAALDGSGCTTIINEVVGTGAGAEGVAIDTDTGKVYLAVGTKILVHTLGTPGTTALPLGSVTPVYTAFPTILKSPAGIAAVTPAGTAQTGSGLTCSATWSAGTPSAALYRAPASATTYVWTRDGAEIPGATTATFVPSTTGSYVCRATASNAAGQTTVASPTVTVTAPAAPAGTAALTVSVKAATSKLRRTATVKLTIRTKNTGAIAATTVKTCVKLAKGFKVSGKAKLCATRASLAAGATATRSITLRAGRKAGSFAIGATAEAANARRVSATGTRRATVKVR